MVTFGVKIIIFSIGYSSKLFLFWVWYCSVSFLLPFSMTHTCSGPQSQQSRERESSTVLRKLLLLDDSDWSLVFYLNGIIRYFYCENTFSLFSLLNLINIIFYLFRGRNNNKGLPQSTVSNLNFICLEKLVTEMWFWNHRPKVKAKKKKLILFNFISLTSFTD